MYQLVIGNKNYSSWSLRPWLAMRVAHIDFEEVNVPLYTELGKAEIRNLSAAGKVPILIANDQTIWDTLAIVEYLSEQHPEKALWPLANDCRAIARSVVCEMHASFFEIRNQLPMNCRVTTTFNSISDELQKDIDRVLQIWQDCRDQYGNQGDFLFGNFSIADAFYAPVVLRFNTYNIPVNDNAQQYMQTILELPEIQEWIESSKQDPTIVDDYELG
jgi:glutathione S-transferase